VEESLSGLTSAATGEGGFRLETGGTKPETPAVHWNKITIIGVGLLGGSLGLALKARHLAGSVAGFVRRQASIDQCMDLGVVDVATLDLSRAVEDADLIVLCTPLAQMVPLVRQMLLAVKSGAVLTDVGSVKGKVVEELEGRVAEAGAHFVGSHPMAGAEKTGPAAARADLFETAVCIVTPTPNSNPQALQAVERLWQSLGSKLLRLSPEVHDDLVSRSSHLPHVVAAELANYVLSADHPKEQSALCANGFRDVTRIASGSPEMWRDIALANRENLSRAIGAFTADLADFQSALERGDAAAVSRFFERAKQRRDEWSAQGASSSPE
jgi:prephenate dehydrogenase